MAFPLPYGMQNVGIKDDHASHLNFTFPTGPTPHTSDSSARLPAFRAGFPEFFWLASQTHGSSLTGMPDRLLGFPNTLTGLLYPWPGLPVRPPDLPFNLLAEGKWKTDLSCSKTPKIKEGRLKTRFKKPRKGLMKCLNVLKHAS